MKSQTIRKYPRVPHPLDHLDLVRQPPLVLLEVVAERSLLAQRPQPLQPLLESVPGDAGEVVVGRLEGRRHVEVREAVHRAGEVDVTALGNRHGVAQRLREVSEDRRHLLRRLQVELIAVVAQPLLVRHVLAGADAQQDVVRVVVRLPQVVHVVGADERQTEIPGDGRQAPVDHLLVVDALVLHLQEEVVRAEDVPERRRGFARSRRLVAAEVGGHLPFQATAESDDAVGVGGQQLLVDARLVVEALGIAGRYELDQVVVAREVRCEQHEMVGRLARDAAVVPPVAVGDVDLAADDRLDALPARLVVERDGGEEIAVLGHRHRRHVEPLDLLEHLPDPAGAVEQRVLRMQMEVNEVGHGASLYSHSIVDGGFELMS